MTSSQSALLINLAVLVVAALLATVAQLRVLGGGTPPRRMRYLVAWVVVTVALGAFMAMGSGLVGRSALSDRAMSVATAAVMMALALLAGARLAASPFWDRARGVWRGLALFTLHLVIVGLADRVLR